jgi:cell division protein ZapA (FtsZ GTPase activity inhibitor)
MKNTGIKVKIFNSDYSLQGENTEEVQKVAGYVDTIMHRINFESPNQSGETIAVVSALNIAENLLKEKKSTVEIQNDFENFLNDCNNRIDEMQNIIDDVL